LPTPPTGKQIFNTTTNGLEIYLSGQWVLLAVTNPTGNRVEVFTFLDLPVPVAGAISLDATKMGYLLRNNRYFTELPQPEWRWVNGH